MAEEFVARWRRGFAFCLLDNSARLNRGKLGYPFRDLGIRPRFDHVTTLYQMDSSSN